MNIGFGFDKTFFDPAKSDYSNFKKHNKPVESNKNAERKSFEAIKPQKASAEISKKNEANLSEKAQKFLADLREKYGDYDLFVGNTDEEMESLSNAGNKEYSVIISADEIEKMADNEDYASSQMQKVEEAIEMTKKIGEESGYKLASEEGEGENGRINKISVTIDGDGNMKFFAELEKSTAKQSERIAKAREKKAEEKKAEESKTNDNSAIKNPYAKAGKDSVKRTTVEANSIEELIEKMKGVDWSQIENAKSGDKFNFMA